MGQDYSSGRIMQKIVDDGNSAGRVLDLDSQSCGVLDDLLSSDLLSSPASEEGVELVHRKLDGVHTPARYQVSKGWKNWREY